MQNVSLKSWQEDAADNISRRHFQMHFFLGALRVNVKAPDFFSSGMMALEYHWAKFKKKTGWSKTEVKQAGYLLTLPAIIIVIIIK